MHYCILIFLLFFNLAYSLNCSSGTFVWPFDIDTRKQIELFDVQSNCSACAVELFQRDLGPIITVLKCVEEVDADLESSDGILYAEHMHCNPIPREGTAATAYCICDDWNDCAFETRHFAFEWWRQNSLADLSTRLSFLPTTCLHRVHMENDIRLRDVGNGSCTGFYCALHYKDPSRFKKGHLDQWADVDTKLHKDWAWMGCEHDITCIQQVELCLRIDEDEIKCCCKSEDWHNCARLFTDTYEHSIPDQARVIENPTINHYNITLYSAIAVSVLILLAFVWCLVNSRQNYRKKTLWDMNLKATGQRSFGTYYLRRRGDIYSTEYYYTSIDRKPSQKLREHIDEQQVYSMNNHVVGGGMFEANYDTVTSRLKDPRIIEKYFLNFYAKK